MRDNIGLPFITDFEVDDQLSWQMSRAEKYCLIHLLQTLKPDATIEIGTFQGGSLQVLSHFSKHVYSIDISEEPKRTLKNKFKNVDFVVGDSKEILPSLMSEIEQSGKKLNFILVDGDHSRKGVYRDLKAILEYPHKNDLTILLHDSFNPECRKGMQMINLDDFPQVSYAELDYISGSFWHDTYREMWGGLALIKISKNNTTEKAHLNRSLNNLFKVTQLHSVHLIKDRLKFLIPLKRKLYKRLKRKHRTDIYFDFEK